MLNPRSLKTLAENVALAIKHRSRANAALKALAARPSYSCPLCGYVGPFDAHGLLQRPNSRCPKCKSVERHRLLKLYLDANPAIFAGKRVIHFAPEPAVRRLVESMSPASYQSADLYAKADLKIDIEAIDLPDGAFDVAVCSHVLEHVDDTKALPELRRILAPGGTLIVMVPYVAAWEETFEPDLQSKEDRQRYLLHPGHLRIYGRDLPERIAAASFTVEEFVANGFQIVDHALLRGEKVFVGRA